jgi:hypothetical protein
VAVSEPQRIALHRAARAALCEEEGDTLMALSPPANTDMATMQALERTEERLSAQMAVAAAEQRAHTWKVMAGTGVLLYLALVGTAFTAYSLL